MRTVIEIDTPAGPARCHLHRPAGPPDGLLVLGHGAGGGIAAADLLAVAGAASVAGWLAVRVEQPWLVAGRRVAPAPPRLDEAWLPILAALTRAEPVVGPLVVGGRSAGARVACRTAEPVGAAAVVCLAFPLHPPGRPERSRLAELQGAARALPVLVVQGRRDAFGTADELGAVAPDGVTLVAVDGDHGLARGAQEAGRAVAGWLTELRAEGHRAPPTG
jgi:predicted alpha/beta-hydrolase family hydrolase